MLTGYLSLVFSFVYVCALATSDQNLVSPIGAKSLGSGFGDAAPAVVYNSMTNDYLVAYTQNDGSCSNERLFGIIIDGVTGNTKSGAFNISDCHNAIEDMQVVYSVDLNEYLIFYKAIGDIGDKSKLYYCSLDGATNAIETSPTQLIGDAIADPFLDLTVSYNDQSNMYALGYHKINAQSETSLTLNYLDAASKAKLVYETYIDKLDFLGSNKGLFGSKLVKNNSNFTLIFELKYDTGSEIWGVSVSSTNGLIINDFYIISPGAASDKFYVNPDAIFNKSTNEIIAVFEQSYFADASGDYILSDTLRIQKFNPSNGSLISPTNVAVSLLPGSTSFSEDKKIPRITYSELSNEYLISFYGVRFAAATNPYNIYLHRIDAANLTSLNSTSIEVIGSVGIQVTLNNYLKPISLVNNSTNNQYLIGWNTDAGNNIQTQIWRYDNNPPRSLVISNTSIIEELPVGTTIGTFSADDPDPEDSSPSFTLTPGAGDSDNSYFDVDGNELKILKRLSFEDASSRSIRIKAIDSQGAATDGSFVITINNTNENPFDLKIAGPLSVEENLQTGLFTSIISVKDDDVGNTHTYSLVAGDSSDNNANFEINQNVLKLIEPLNYEDTSEQYIRIRATDNTGLYTEKAFTIEVIDVNEVPEKIELYPEAIPENDITSSMTLQVIDPDEYSNYVFSQVNGEGDDDNDIFGLSDNTLRPLILLDYEVRNTYSVRLRAFDGVNDTTQVFSISVSDLNDLPDSIRLSENRIETGQPSGSTIGQLITYDQDVNDSHTYRIIEGGQLFFLNGPDLRILNSLQFDFSNPYNNFYSVTIESTDTQGGLKIETLNVEVVLFKDDLKPEIHDFDKNQKLLNNSASVLNISVSVTDNIELDTVYFFHRPIRDNRNFNEPDSIKIDLRNGNFYVDVFLPKSALDVVGIEYFFKAIDAAGNSDSTEIGYTYWSHIQKSFDVVNEFYNGAADSYKIIANPYLLESKNVSKIFADYGSSSKDSWRLFSFDNTGNYKEIGNQAAISIDQGKGYWFNKTGDLKQPIILDNARTGNNKTDTYKLKLKQGWNLIGNPYPFELNWDYVLETNGLSYNAYELITFNSTYIKSSSLKEFEGGFVYSDTEKTLEIPIEDPNLSGNRIAKASEFENGWLLNLTLEIEHNKNELSGIGMHQSADDSYDHYDRPLLPRFINYLDLSFNHSEHNSKAFAQDIVSLQENYIWEFVASTNLKNTNATLRWDKDFLNKSPNQLYLYDVLHDNLVNVRLSTKYEFSLDEPTTFKAIYGDQTFIQETLSKIKIEALKPYPNPFNQTVSIPINLPYSADSYDIECNIYNLMGDRVYNKNIENLEYGFFQIDWNESENGNLEEGIYIYSIKVKNGFLTNNFHGRIVKN